MGNKFHIQLTGKWVWLSVKSAVPIGNLLHEGLGTINELPQCYFKFWDCGYIERYSCNCTVTEINIKKKKQKQENKEWHAKKYSNKLRIIYHVTLRARESRINKDLPTNSVLWVHIGYSHLGLLSSHTWTWSVMPLSHCKWAQECIYMYFDCITMFEVPYLKGGADMCFVDAWISDVSKKCVWTFPFNKMVLQMWQSKCLISMWVCRALGIVDLAL